MPADEPDQTDKPEQARLTRTQVAERLGISSSAVRRREGVTLHPVQDDHGVWRFDAGEVGRAANATRRRNPSAPAKRNARPGDIAARVFRLFEQGHGLRDIVVRARQSPELVRRLYREWLIGLADGERLRQQDEVEQRQRRELLEDERMHLEHLQILSR